MGGGDRHRRRSRSESVERRDTKRRKSDNKRHHRDRDRDRSSSRSRSPSDDRRRHHSRDHGHNGDKGVDNNKRSTDRGERGSRKKDRSSRDRGDEKRSSHKRSRRELSPSSDGSASDDNDGTDDKDDEKLTRKSRKDESKKKKKKSKSSSHKKDEKKSKKKHKKHHKKDHSSSSTKKKHHSSANTAADAAELTEKARNYALSEALHQLLTAHPTADMSVNTLPLVLLKLGSGTSLDLRQMPDRAAASALGRVLSTLECFGVTQLAEGEHGEQQQQVWKWQVPGGKGGPPADERILLRIVRTLLNDIGFSIDTIEQREQHHQNSKKAALRAAELESTQAANQVANELAAIENRTISMLQDFQSKAKAKEDNDTDDEAKPSTLPGELGGLCKMILEGESIALDGLPDASLRTALETLFQSCGLELCEIEEDDESDDDAEEVRDGDGGGETEKNMGYALPDSTERLERAQAKLSSVMGACEQVASNPTLSVTATKRATKGPMRMPTNYQAPEESSDEEGPAPVGAAARRKESALSKEQLKQQAEMRARQLKGAVTGIDELMSTDPNQREEWMLVPGKFDFLSSIKSGNPMKSRNFQAASKADKDGPGEKAIHPRVKAEMDAIMQAHADARGPTLVEQHRLNKEETRQQQAAAAANAGGGQWNWNRDKDLDSGRRVDKNALNMVLGGANTELNKKFHGGF